MTEDESVAVDHIANLENSGASTPNSTAGANTSTKAPKDRNCPFCGQAFTSSSLGRHLDLYIKAKNPKPSDGIHDVDEIKKLRGNITRRQPRNSNRGASGDRGGRVSKRETQENGDGTMRNGNTRTDDDSHTRTRSPMAEDSPVLLPTNAKGVREGHNVLNSANWQATGVINNLPPRGPSQNERENTPRVKGLASRQSTEARHGSDAGKMQQPDNHEDKGMWRLQQDNELGRAAEMALREVLGSLEAAQKKVEPKNLFDEFDFFCLSFPGLCLAILPPPSTLFSPTPFPSAESWTLGPPGVRQYEALVRFAKERTMIKRKTAPQGFPDSAVFRHHTHLSGAWEHWQNMTENERSSAWNLEILRSFTRIQEQNRNLRTELEHAQQHGRHLEAEYDRLSRCQLPREYLMHPPNTIPVAQEVLHEINSSHANTEAAKADWDIEKLISRWKGEIKSTNRPLRAVPATTGNNSAATSTSIYKEPYQYQMRDDMIMQGAIYNIMGPMPRGQPLPRAGTSVAYETPSDHGQVVDSNDGDTLAYADMDAEGEVDDDEMPQDYQNALVKRVTNGSRSMARALNANGKRRLSTSGNNGNRILGPRTYRARDDG